MDDVVYRKLKYKSGERETSDSEASTHSEDYILSDTDSFGTLTLVAQFDEIVRLLKQKRNHQVEDAFIHTTQTLETVLKEFYATKEEVRKLEKLLDTKAEQLSDVECKLSHARKIIDDERRRSRNIERERDELEVQVAKVRQLLFHDTRNKLPDDTREKLSFLNPATYGWDPNVPADKGGLSAIQEVNTTGSILSELSYSRSEDDIDGSFLQNGKSWGKQRASVGAAHEPAQKKRRSSQGKVVEISNTDTVRATTTVTVPKHGPITATSVIESFPPADGVDGKYLDANGAQPSAALEDAWQKTPTRNERAGNVRQHSLHVKTIVLPETCGPCEKRIKFGKTALKCKDCRASCHPECKDKLPLPCVPFVSTPNQRNILGLISDYTPTTPPMIPALIIHCVNEIELRGLTEIGVYRIPGAERDVKQLKEKFLRGKGAPPLSNVDVHVICGTVKDFLRSLHEPLITYGLWPKFVRCLEMESPESAIPILQQLILELPQPNRDTLAYMILHLKRVGLSKECKMPISNLSKIFGPTIVGYSSMNPNQENLIPETRQQHMVMEALLNMPGDYWSSFINTVDACQTPDFQKTPSTDSLLRPTPYKPLYKPRSTLKRKQKFFPTPPRGKP